MPILSTRAADSARGYGELGKSGPYISGGTLYSDSNYYYMAITSSATLTITGGNVTADILAVAGGGAGGGQG